MPLPHTDAALVEVVEAKGSTPREAGAAMLVTADGIVGTIGGGTLEWRAMRAARALLSRGEDEARLRVPLGPEIGQCCGGYVTLVLRRASEADIERLEAVEARATRLALLLFGAGHVGRAVARAVHPLPFDLRWIDERPDACTGEALVIHAANPLTEVEAAPAGAAYLVLTHSHARDFELCEAVLRRGDAAYLGLIGSATKRARFVKGLEALGLDTKELVCPIGSATIRDKRPAVIAALVAAELIAVMNKKTGGAKE
ncbi:MAG: xanthine dehydrogenase accessory protein XdhC [Geminicoccaceae bacterium]|nr:xanthine dehydrogenase accessory protein XdhC [Geminicoccaceae bacterium]